MGRPNSLPGILSRDCSQVVPLTSQGNTQMTLMDRGFDNLFLLVISYASS